jgi:hypothetical protein
MLPSSWVGSADSATQKGRLIVVARLVVEALAPAAVGPVSGAAKPGNQNPLKIVVSVTRNNGVALTSLTDTSFRVQAILVAAGGGLVTVQSVAELQPGVYLVEVIPIPAATWLLGVYTFWVAVNHGSNAGQALCSVLVE